MGKLRIILVFCMLMGSQAANAFDENRQGFVLGVGAGLHSTDIDYNFGGAPVGSESESGLATSFKIGWGFTNQFLLYYVRNASWYSSTVTDGFTTTSATTIFGISGLGASFYFNELAPAFYILGAVGVGDMSAPFESNVETYSGDAIMLGAGYEMSKHVHFELTWLDADIESDDFSTNKAEGSSIQFTVNYVWY